MKRLIACVVSAVLIGIAYYVLTKPMDVRSALPFLAVVTMHEFYQDSAPLPDFIHCVSAEITEPEFKSFITQMNLVPYRGAEAFPSCEAKWWAASGDSSQAFYDPKQKEGAQAMAKFENGRLYFVASDT